MSVRPHYFRTSIFFWSGQSYLVGESNEVGRLVVVVVFGKEPRRRFEDAPGLKSQVSSLKSQVSSLKSQVSSLKSGVVKNQKVKCQSGLLPGCLSACRFPYLSSLLFLTPLSALQQLQMPS